MSRGRKEDLALELRIARRLESSRSAEKTPAFERLVTSLRLDSFEPNVLTIALGTGLSRNLLKAVGAPEGESFAASVTAESHLLLAELGFEERVGRRSASSPRGKLIANDLEMVDVRSLLRSPVDLLESVIEATHRAARIAVGDASLDDELLDHSSVTEPLATCHSVVILDDDRRRELTELKRFASVAIMATHLPQDLGEALMRRVLVKVRFPEPDFSSREQI